MGQNYNHEAEVKNLVFNDEDCYPRYQEKCPSVVITLTCMVLCASE